MTIWKITGAKNQKRKRAALKRNHYDPDLPYLGYYILQCVRSAYDERIISSLGLFHQGWVLDNSASVTGNDLRAMQDFHVNVTHDGNAPAYDPYKMNVMIPPGESRHFQRQCFEEFDGLVSNHEPSSFTGINLYCPACIE